MKNSTRLATFVGFACVVAVVAACSTPPVERAPVCRPEPYAGPYPPPAPQVMVSDASAANAPPAPVVLHQVTVAPMSETERTAKLAAASSTADSYTPAPFPEPAPRRFSVRFYGGVPSYYYDDGAPYWRDPYWYSPTADLGRIATYTAAGAIIGHQYHQRGRGAAIGLGLALFGAPWWGWHHHGWCWDD